MYSVFFFNDTATTEIYTLSLHDALPISAHLDGVDGELVLHRVHAGQLPGRLGLPGHQPEPVAVHVADQGQRSEEHTSELQSRQYLVCRLLLEKKKKAELTRSVLRVQRHH